MIRRLNDEGYNSALIWFLAEGDVTRLEAVRSTLIWDAVAAIEKTLNKWAKKS